MAEIRNKDAEFMQLEMEFASNSKLIEESKMYTLVYFRCKKEDRR